MQAVRNDEKNDTVQDRKADDPAVQPAAKVQPDKKITKKANRAQEKGYLKKRPVLIEKNLREKDKHSSEEINPAPHIHRRIHENFPSELADPVELVGLFDISVLFVVQF